MSGHLIGCASLVEGIGSSQKLALLAFADSADDRTHIGFPGYPGVMTWANVSRSRSAELIRDLVAAGYLELHKSARPGRRAEYVVFPRGCCDLHRAPAPEDGNLDLQALAAAAGVSVDQVATLISSMRPDTPNGSEISDSSSGDGSDASDPSDQEAATGPKSRPTRQSGRTRTGVRVQNASDASDPSTTSTTPLTPASGGASCAKPGPLPHPNCRACATTPRQLQQAKDHAAAERRRLADQAAAAESRARRDQIDQAANAAPRAKARQALQATR